MGDARKELVKGISGLFNSVEYSDLTIHIGNTALPAHSLILGIQSEYFKKALGEGFQEGETKDLRFESGSRHAYWRVFEYLYTGAYSDDACQHVDVDDDLDLFKHIRVYALADYFSIDELKGVALNRFKRQLQHLWTSETLFECIRETYSTTHERDNAMRAVVVDTVSAHISILGERTAFKDLVRGNGDFAVDLVCRLSRGEDDCSVFM